MIDNWPNPDFQAAATSIADAGVEVKIIAELVRPTCPLKTTAGLTTRRCSMAVHFVLPAATLMTVEDEPQLSVLFMVCG